MTESLGSEGQFNISVFGNQLLDNGFVTRGMIEQQLKEKQEDPSRAREITEAFTANKRGDQNYISPIPELSMRNVLATTANYRGSLVTLYFDPAIIDENTAINSYLEYQAQREEVARNQIKQTKKKKRSKENKETHDQSLTVKIVGYDSSINNVRNPEQKSRSGSRTATSYELDIAEIEGKYDLYQYDYYNNLINQILNLGITQEKLNIDIKIIRGCIREVSQFRDTLFNSSTSNIEEVIGTIPNKERRKETTLTALIPKKLVSGMTLTILETLSGNNLTVFVQNDYLSTPYNESLIEHWRTRFTRETLELYRPFLNEFARVNKNAINILAMLDDPNIEKHLQALKSDNGSTQIESTNETIEKESFDNVMEHIILDDKAIVRTLFCDVLLRSYPIYQVIRNHREKLGEGFISLLESSITMIVEELSFNELSNIILYEQFDRTSIQREITALDAALHTALTIESKVQSKPSRRKLANSKNGSAGIQTKLNELSVILERNSRKKEGEIISKVHKIVNEKVPISLSSPDSYDGGEDSLAYKATVKDHNKRVSQHQDSRMPIPDDYIGGYNSIAYIRDESLYEGKKSLQSTLN